MILVNKRLDPFESNSHIVPLMRDRSIMQVQNAQTEGLLDIQTDPNLSRSENICRYINQLNMKPKAFFRSMIESTDPLITKRRQYWGTSTGWDSTKKVILALKGLVLDSSDGSKRWNEFILQEASLSMKMINIKVRINDHA